LLWPLLPKAEHSMAKNSIIRLAKVSALEQSGRKMGLCFYILDLSKIALGGLIVASIPLFIPVRDPADGFMANIPYFFAYNPYVLLIYNIGSWLRIQRIFSRHEDEPLVELKLTPKTIGVMAAGWLIGNAYMATNGYLLGTGVGTSYEMMYCAPVVCTTCDVFFFFLLPREEQTFDAFKLLVIYALCCGLPIFILFGPIVVAIYLPSSLASWMPVILFILLEVALQAFARTLLLDGIIHRMGLSKTMWVGCGVPLHLSSMLTMGEMMLFSGADSPMLIITVVVVETIRRVSDMRNLNKQLADLRDTYSQLPESTGNAIAVDLSTEAEEGSDVAIANLISPKVYDELVEAGMVHCVTLTSPLIFAAMSSLIVNLYNKSQYYAYECISVNENLVAIVYAMIYWIASLGLFVMDIAFFHGAQALHFFSRCMCSYLREDAWLLVFTLAFVDLVYTSCYFIKHDGMAVLTQIGNCS